MQPTLEAKFRPQKLRQGAYSKIAMDNRRFDSLPTHELDQLEALAYKELRQRCADSGLLERPVGLGESDVPDGVNDDVTILYALFTMISFGLKS